MASFEARYINFLLSAHGERCEKKCGQKGYDIAMKNFLKDVSKNKSRLVMTLPALIYYFCFSYMPMFGLVIAFQNFSLSKGVFRSQFVGLKNFEFLFKTSDAWLITRNTVCYNLVFIILGMFLACCLAIILDILGRNPVTQVCQTVVLFPQFISWMAGSYLVLAMLDTDKGMLNNLLQFFGKAPVNWYSTPTWWPIILVVCNLWKHLGYDSIIYYSTIKGFSNEYYEAARIEGATWFQQIRYITFPLMKSILIIMGILKIGGIFASDFGLFYLVTRNSGPLYGVTSTIDTYVYNGMMSGGQQGMTAAVGFYQSIVGFLLVIGTNAVVRKVSPEDAMF